MTLHTHTGGPIDTTQIFQDMREDIMLMGTPEKTSWQG